MAKRKFHLTRSLMYGMTGEDVRKMQQWLNTANQVYRFYAGEVPESGSFDMFRTRICLTQFQDWGQITKSHVYDQATHSFLHNCVNETLRMLNYPPQSLWDK